jgi:hypothetical protein
MKRSDTRASQPRWRTFGGAALTLAAVAVIGITSVTPAKADWRRERHEHGGVGFGLSFGAPAYGYYPYPAYPAYGYDGGYYPYYGGYYPYYGGPSVDFEFGRR